MYVINTIKINLVLISLKLNRSKIGVILALMNDDINSQQSCPCGLIHTENFRKINLYRDNIEFIRMIFSNFHLPYARHHNPLLYSLRTVQVLSILVKLRENCYIADIDRANIPKD